MMPWRRTAATYRALVALGGKERTPMGDNEMIARNIVVVCTAVVLRHVTGCGAINCWIDTEGTEWHLGSRHGVYIRFRGEEAVHFLHSGDSSGDGHPWTTGIVVDLHDLLTSAQALKALRA